MPVSGEEWARAGARSDTDPGGRGEGSVGADLKRHSR